MTLVHGFGQRDLIGRPLESLPEPGPLGVTFQQTGETPMASKAPNDGVYTLDGDRYWIQAGHPLPDGAVMDESEPVSVEPVDEPQERAKGRAPQNKAKGAAPENRSE